MSLKKKEFFLKRVILGFLLGAVMFIAFVFLGGAGFLEKFGEKVSDAGTELKHYESQLKESSEKLKDKLDEAKVAAKEKVGEKTEELIEEVVEETKEKIKESF